MGEDATQRAGRVEGPIDGIRGEAPRIPRHTAAMAAGSPFVADRTDRAILAALQADGRRSTADLARDVRMSASAVAERIRRMEEAGVIRGYRAVVDPEALGYAVLAHLRLRYPSSSYGPLHALLAEIPEVLEADHVTGDDCFVLKVVATSMRHLEQVTGRIGALGSVTTSVAYSSPVVARPITPPVA
jgi:Lrp/AsnC family transcriptional regulator, leucine-responsive regulatory protein